MLDPVFGEKNEHTRGLQSVESTYRNDDIYALSRHRGPEEDFLERNFLEALDRLVPTLLAWGAKDLLTP